MLGVFLGGCLRILLLQFVFIMAADRVFELDSGTSGDSSIHDGQFRVDGFYFVRWQSSWVA